MSPHSCPRHALAHPAVLPESNLSRASDGTSRRRPILMVVSLSVSPLRKRTPRNSQKDRHFAEGSDPTFGLFCH